jgi:hypothetical protein
MTPDEIRKNYQGNTPCYDVNIPQQAITAGVAMLAEIAAQLAELNHHLQYRSIATRDYKPFTG